MVYSGGPYLDFGLILSSHSAIGPINLSYGRMTDRLQDIMNYVLTDFVPWEWWIDYTGQIHMGQERSRDKTAVINLIHGGRLNEVEVQRSTKQSAQRVRVTTGGESGSQDESTSDWQEDTDAMDIINSFYEVIESDREVSEKGVADALANVLLTQLKDPREEITFYDVDLFPFTANDYDVGDYITVTDVKYTTLSGSYRIKTIEKTIDAISGETLNITVSKKRTDISDRLANIYKRLQKLMTSSTYTAHIYAQGGSQNKIKTDILEDVWSQTASNKYYTELPEDDADPNIVECDFDGNISYACSKDEFVVTCAANSYGDVMLDQNRLKFSRSPRFVCDFEIDTDEGDEWEDGDFCFIRIWQVDDTGGLCAAPWGDSGFGFEIYKNPANSQYELWIYSYDGESGTAIQVKLANISIDTIYTIEARMEWKEKIVLFYFGRPDIEEGDVLWDTWGIKLRGIAPLPVDCVDQENLVPFHVDLDSRHGAATQVLVVPIYRWKTQATKVVNE